MLRGEANFLLCDHHPDAGAVVGKILNSAHGPLSCWLGGGVSVYSDACQKASSGELRSRSRVSGTVNVVTNETSIVTAM